MDSSWFINWDGFRVILDPWLVGSEVDGGRWLNEQWHTTSPVKPEEVPEADYLLISQSYSDHCHPETLKFLPSYPILATSKANSLLKKKFKERNVFGIPENRFLEVPGFSNFSALGLRPGKLIDPIYFSVILKKGKQAIFISPHGFELNSKQKELIKDLDFKLLITTFSDFRLPQIFGGHVNPGMENVDYLINLLKPNFVVNSHDEEKEMKGLVGKLARVQYPKVETIQFENCVFVPITDYSAKEF